jgi:NAD(P)-dependent dehydrogenase (short-subunit alcohol dehydrogenase family)
MTDEQSTGWTSGQRAFGDFAPGMAHYTDKVLFDEVWEREGLSKRDRSLITVAALTAMGEERSAHLPPRLRPPERRHRDRAERSDHPPRLLRRLAQRDGRHDCRQAGVRRMSGPITSTTSAGNPVYDFSGHVAFVTGASSGMGLATARAFAEAGAAVTLADISDDALRTAERELVDAGHRVLAVRCDVSDEDQVAAAVARTVETFGSLNLAYNNAGIQSPVTDAADETAEVFDRVNGINLRGIWASMKRELAQMRSQGSGAIVNCSSLGGLVGLPGRGAYHASKHGVIGLTRSAALEYAPRGIRINAICPGTIETPMVTAMFDSGDLDRDEAAASQPIGRLGSAEEMAAAVLWLCSPGASFVVWVALPVDGGYTAR